MSFCGIRVKRLSELPPEEQRRLTQFDFVGGPLEYPDNDEMNLPFAAYGFAATAWSRLETHIDAALIHINKPQYSVDLFDMDHPISFARKLKLLKRWFGQHKAPSEHKDDLRALAIRLKALSSDRNILFHSLFSAYDADKMEITLRSISYEGNGLFHLAQREFSTRILIRFGQAANAENRALYAITSQIFTSDIVAQLKKS
jgi:hypothetical protein